ncbi:hypothetical protein FOXG_14799 [Fusarium oxysporum f. sp. lycopersici 4287]|uniref:Protein kinase domain-containing protein n=2 Tax=Fusarium oxysporum TaxID=5507 RepID=A0A0J9WTQ3_FUSO4|nr:hypothetical protein FOXG_14799 [Fusarium oxysporum f. sp. lycopersici 4287]KNB16432.1 hypothetical protein FOXG_14799 [Fusarium oxysporum f. sp. lycopersici 4287]
MAISSNTDQTRVALKELKNLSEQNYNVHVSWLNEANALFQIAELRHKHLISQATAFKQGERRFIMLEWANGGTLRDIWQTESHDRSFLDGNKVMRVLEELTGLASALSKLHGTNTRTKTAKATSADRTKKGATSRSKTIFSQGQADGDGNRLTVPKIRFEGVSSDDGDDSSDNAEEQHWRHGDLKPENILHFRDEKSPWLGTLKIADLGLAKQHVFATTQRQDPTRQRYTTSHYEAPEVITTMNSRVPRSRRYDIWSMGCIIFEYMIWLLYGYEEGLRSFYNEEKDINTHQETLYFTADLITRQAQVSDVARSWISHILDVDPECNRATPSVIRDLVVLVRDKLLVVDLPQGSMSQDDIKMCRASADDLERSLKNIKRMAIDDEQKGGRYLSSGKSRNEVSPPRPQRVRRQSFLSTSSGSTSKQSNLTSHPFDFKLRLKYKNRFLRAVIDLNAQFNDTWNHMEDKSIALEVLRHHEVEITDSMSMSQEKIKLCEECKKLEYWSDKPLISENLATMRSKVQQCALHRIVCRAFRPHAYKDLDIIEIRRFDSWLVMGTMKMPLLSLFKISENLDSRLSVGLEVGHFPSTFRHAIEVTRALGVPYLWIDSLCIVQGPDGDFDTEAKRMETVFSSAYCVIAASRANGTSSGFLWERPEREAVRLDGYLTNDSVYVCEAIDDFQHDVIEGALNKRGWVLQERALAPRTIYFTENQTYWECGHGQGIIPWRLQLSQASNEVDKRSKNPIL